MGSDGAKNAISVHFPVRVLIEAIQFDAIAILGPSSVCSAGAVLYRVAGLNEIHRTNMTITWSLLRSNDTVPVVSDESTPDQIIFDASLTEPTDVNRLSATVDAQLCNGRYILTASINIRRSDTLSKYSLIEEKSCFSSHKRPHKLRLN